MLSPRKIDISTDKNTLLELHCLINHASESPWAKEIPFEQYRDKWLDTSQPEVFLKDLAESMPDEKTIAEIWEDAGTVIGYLWVTFSEIDDYSITIAEVRDIIVTSDYRRQGTGSKIMAHAEQLARERGADILRSETGMDNIASQKLHISSGFETYRIQYEKLLTNPLKQAFE